MWSTCLIISRGTKFLNDVAFPSLIKRSLGSKCLLQLWEYSRTPQMSLTTRKTIWTLRYGRFEKEGVCGIRTTLHVASKCFHYYSKKKSQSFIFFNAINAINAEYILTTPTCILMLLEIRDALFIYTSQLTFRYVKR